MKKKWCTREKKTARGNAFTWIVVSVVCIVNCALFDSDRKREIFRYFLSVAKLLFACSANSSMIWVNHEKLCVCVCASERAGRRRVDHVHSIQIKFRNSKCAQNGNYITLLRSSRETEYIYIYTKWLQPAKSQICFSALCISASWWNRRERIGNQKSFSFDFSHKKKIWSSSGMLFLLLFGYALLVHKCYFNIYTFFLLFHLQRAFFVRGFCFGWVCALAPNISWFIFHALI